MPGGVILLVYQNYTTAGVYPKSHLIKYFVNSVKILCVLEILWDMLILCPTSKILCTKRLPENCLHATVCL